MLYMLPDVLDYDLTAMGLLLQATAARKRSNSPAVDLETRSIFILMTRDIVIEVLKGCFLAMLE